MSTLRLVPVSGPPVEVEKEQNVVGRDPGCDIVVTDGSVSRRHARLELRGSEWWVIDQGSANGTYVNSVRVAEQAVKTGQELRFGALSYQVDLVEDPEATVATPVLDEHAEATVASLEPPPPITAPPAKGPALPPPLPAPPASPRVAAPPRAAAPPPAPRPPATPVTPRAAARPAAPGPAARRASSPVPQMPAAGSAAPAKKGRSPLVWVGVGCCGCLLLVLALMAVIGGGVYVSTKGAADAAHAWIADVRQGGSAAGAAHVSSGYSSQVTEEDNAAVTAAIQQSSDATFYQRSIENDRALMRGVLTGGGSTQPVSVHLVKEAGAWKVDSVRLAAE